MKIVLKSTSIACYLIPFILMIGCSENKINETAQTNASEKLKIEYLLPAQWETFEVLDNQYGGSDHSVVTKLATFVSVYSYPGGSRPDFAGAEYFLKRYLVESMPTNDIREAARIDMGELTREGFEGQFVHVKIPEPNKASYIIEVYELHLNEGDAVVVFNTSEEQLPLLQQELNIFIKSINFKRN